jgi:hypothetical protein
VQYKQLKEHNLLWFKLIDFTVVFYNNLFIKSAIDL